MTPTFTFTNGCTIGIEHLTAPDGMESDGVQYMIVIHLLFVKLCLLKFK